MTTFKAVSMAFPKLKPINKKLITLWYNEEADPEEFSRLSEYAEYIHDDFLDMFWAGDYNSPEFKRLRDDMIRCGYFTADDFPPESKKLSENQKVTLTIGQLKKLVKEDVDPDIDRWINGAKTAVINRIVYAAGIFFEDHPDATEEMIAQEVVDELKHDDDLLDKVKTLYLYLKQKTAQDNL